MDFVGVFQTEWLSSTYKQFVKDFSTGRGGFCFIPRYELQSLAASTLDVDKHQEWTDVSRQHGRFQSWQQHD